MNFLFIYFGFFSFTALQGSPVPPGRTDSFEVKEKNTKTDDDSTKESLVSKQIKENGSELDQISKLLQEIFVHEKSQGETGNIAFRFYDQSFIFLIKP